MDPETGSRHHMSAQLSKADRPQFASGDWFDGTPEDYRSEATSYIAYSGPFHVDEDKHTLTHSMFVSLFPNWIGQTQPRVEVQEEHVSDGRRVVVTAGAAGIGLAIAKAFAARA